MNSLPKILFIALLAAGCHAVPDTNDTREDKTGSIEQKETNMNDTTPKVTGIGGIFFRSENPREISAWYGNTQVTGMGDQRKQTIRLS